MFSSKQSHYGVGDINESNAGTIFDKSSLLENCLGQLEAPGNTAPEQIEEAVIQHCYAPAIHSPESHEIFYPCSPEDRTYLGNDNCSDTSKGIYVNEASNSCIDDVIISSIKLIFVE